MKNRLITSLQSLANDRYLMSVLVLFVILAVGALVFLSLSIIPSERQVAVHYTSYGTTNFYRDKWYYLLTLVVYVLVMLVSHLLLTYKIFKEKGHELAVAFAWLSVALIVISITFFIHILRIASII